ncbi:hypothetical protein P7410_28560 [Vibrio parahaemolyticus]|nr:hypothetical protein [Vibrio parahaemolyticus]MDG3027566.1 hypothetical protein [Vibrio parahaemolyticus]HCG7772942.1 hypothetical protein [Vibrio parahaemolyticus]
MPIDKNAEANIRYEKSFVAFLDVLGFKQMIKSKDPTQINQYFGIVDSAIRYLKSIPSKKNIDSIVISDSIILSAPCTDSDEDNLERLRQLCIAIGLIQQSLAIKGIWLRGAICYGDTHFDSINSQIVGPAYVEAYLLEEKLAVNPRVILDSKLIPQLGYRNATELIDAVNKADQGGFQYSNWGSRVLFEWSDPIGNLVTEIDQDLPLFIDYLSPLLESYDTQDIEKVLDNIQTSMYSNVQVYSKYRWVVDYIKAISNRASLNDYQLEESLLFKLEQL